MQISSESAKKIDAFLKSTSDAEIGKWPIEIGGEKRILPFFRLPIDLLRYNTNNGRLAMDIREWEETEGRRLDDSDSNDISVIRGLLLQLDERKTRELKEDIRKKGQMEPGVITHNGVVINANRRMAVIEQLHEEEPTGKWKYLEVVRLDSSTSEADLWKIEAGLQLSKEKVAEYHPVNELLKIKEGKDRGLEPSEIAAAMYGRDEEYVNDALQRLGLIDEFLRFMRQVGKYGVIKKFGLHEYFIDIQRLIEASKQDNVKSRDRAKRLQHAFALLRANIHSQGRGNRQAITHRDLRKLKDIYRDPYAREAFAERLDSAKKIQNLDDEEILESFNEAIDILQLRDAKDKPASQVKRAIRALEAIDMDSEFYKEDPQVEERLEQLINLAHRHHRQNKGLG